ncbi:hypothetical protein MESS2_810013 [Mesorhizobium metallidurans STM 2683]|uniref:Uncharacterized protein n=1 Tax=Mesorhizobium metallidurans STM 2683 TaxID=1297569 RepID=M5EVL3_9HYPH|nr:hypothetical protein MESS2_810013 [Mesorhizobium metallidurans STM 2683]
MGRHRLRCRRHGYGIGRRCLPGLFSRAIAGCAGVAPGLGRHGKDRPGGELDTASQLIASDRKQALRFERNVLPFPLALNRQRIFGESMESDAIAPIVSDEQEGMGDRWSRQS